MRVKFGYSEFNPYLCGNKNRLKMTREELLERYAAGERDFSGVNLDGVNISGVDLNWSDEDYLFNSFGVDLSGLNLEFADMRGVNLSGVNLTGAKLRGSELFGAIIDNKNRKIAFISGAKL